jgi:methylated-DNA-[protein]-cysteine S-methyltransferase
MNRPASVCPELEMDLIATATGDADPATSGRVRQHAGACAPCQAELERYRVVEDLVDRWRAVPVPPGAVATARKRLEERLDDLRRRTVAYRIFPSPLGNLLIAVSERGVVLVEYLGQASHVRDSRLSRLSGVEAMEDGAEVEARHRELMEYLEGRRTRLEWPLDLQLARSDFHRQVLEAAIGIPYGAVASYAGLACELGKPTAARAVAQALRHNPLPIVIPCHRVVGTSGALTGYAGNKTDLKQQLLMTEGVRTVKRQRELRVPQDAMYVVSAGSSEYCLPSCSWLDRVEHPHRLRFFGTRERAEASGLAPCTDCRPDLHPLPS